MSAKAPNIPTTQQVGQWLEHDQQLFKEGAVIDHIGRLSITHAQYETLSAQAPVQDTFPIRLSTAETQHLKAENQEAMTPERLKEIMSNSLYRANPYIGGRDAVMYNGLNGKVNAPIFDDLHYYFPSKEIEKPFTDAGVSELVTIAEMSKFDLRDGKRFSEPGSWLKGEHKGEPIYAVQYMTLTAVDERIPDSSKPSGYRSAQKYKYTENRAAHWKNMTEEEVDSLSDSDKHWREAALKQERRSSEYNYTMLLPESLAKELGEAMVANPQLARELGDMLVSNPAAKQGWMSNLKDWKDWKPPYEEWRDTNGGIDRMAFRTTSDQSVEQAKIVEY